MVFMDFDPRDKRVAISTVADRLQEAMEYSKRLDKDRKIPFTGQLPVLPSVISTNNPYNYNIGPFSPAPIGSISPIEENKTTPIPRKEIPPRVGNNASFPIAPVTPQEQRPNPEPSFWDKLSRFSQSDVSKNIDDFLLGAITASPDSSGWQLFARGLKNLHEGDKQRGKVNQTVEYLKSKGYSEEEARVMAGNKNALNAVLLQKMTGNNDPRSKEEMDRLRETIELKNSEAISSNTINDIERFMAYMEEKGEWATGNLANMQAQLSVPQHRDMSSLLDSIKNRIGIDRLETMRRYSRNGASGFGNLTEKELDILKSYLGEIKYNLGHKELLFRLKKIREILGKMKSDVLALLENGNIALTQENVDKVTLQPHSVAPQQGRSDLPLVTSKEQEDALPSGARFVGEDGKTRVKGA
ncbi:hypothetical protein [Bartonella raoultii]|uniref:Uncharacterized protein n=1 Tax=Bartonella raoultii TaxID=1457020 RepID=A0ABS7I8P0_9HYPH|nr:hypothetical protein [Bartonella raoultii]MBX4336012.1 hypothetical protein [Bartonella raoultii]